MTRAELVRRFRHDTRDFQEPYLWPDEWVFDALDDATAEAALRGRLLYAEGDPGLCRIEVVPGQSVYPLNPALYELVSVRLRFGHRSDPLRLVSVEALDDADPAWRDRTGTPRYAVQDDTSLRLTPIPDQPCEIYIEAFRLPLAKLADGDENSEPEIHPANHRMLLEWVKHMAYSQPDTDAMDLDRAALAERAFSNHFGLRPDADLRRLTREDQPYNKAIFL